MARVTKEQPRTGLEGSALVDALGANFGGVATTSDAPKAGEIWVHERHGPVVIVCPYKWGEEPESVCLGNWRLNRRLPNRSMLGKFQETPGGYIFQKFTPKKTDAK